MRNTYISNVYIFKQISVCLFDILDSSISAQKEIIASNCHTLTPFAHLHKYIYIYIDANILVIRMCQPTNDTLHCVKRIKLLSLTVLPKMNWFANCQCEKEEEEEESGPFSRAMGESILMLGKVISS